MLHRLLGFGLVLALMAAFAGLLSTRGVAEDAKRESEDCYKFVAPLSSVMEIVESVFLKMPDKLKSENYKDLKREGQFLAEMANLATHVKENRSNKEWLGLAESMKTNSLKLSEAAGKKDGAGVKAAHAEIEKTCDACHEKFRDA